MTRSIALLGEYTPTFPPHLSTNAAIEHVKSAKGLDINADWISTADINPPLFARYDGIWIAPGSPYKDMDKTLEAIRNARENKIPCFGTCGGFQHMIIEYARNILGFKDAQHTEYDPYASNLFISQLACSLAGREMQLCFEPNSQVADIYGAIAATEQYYCNFGINPDYVDALKQGPMQISGADAEGDIRVIEWPSHPFFIGTLFVPQARSTPAQPHPLVSAFLSAVAAISNS
ncbi:CTP synthase [Methylomonas sp. MO1]|uniref:CTP synthase C-terminal region-related (seleno)protein n=1 Tax=Methylomonas sp. MO1 TaxID=3073619 RepID=UPI0028A34A4C|nr:CTP synthase [Methylomonas sp. MO1]MDT4291713.1 CTP synthase [Methylomonas sp. MO1]